MTLPATHQQIGRALNGRGRDGTSKHALSADRGLGMRQTTLTKTIGLPDILYSRDVRAAMMRCGRVEHIVCHQQNKVCFVLTSTKTIVMCSTGTFIVKYDHRNYRMQLERLREMIRQRVIRSMADLIDFCKFRPGNYASQMCGLQLVPTRLERHI